MPNLNPHQGVWQESMFASAFAVVHVFIFDPAATATAHTLKSDTMDSAAPVVRLGSTPMGMRAVLVQQSILEDNK
jgi:hypothetical protein